MEELNIDYKVVWDYSKGEYIKILAAWIVDSARLKIVRMLSEKNDRNNFKDWADILQDYAMCRRSY